MDEFAESLERELQSAVEVKDKDSLHRYVRLLIDGTVGRVTYEDGFTRLSSGIDELKSDVKIIAERIETMQQQMDRRFETMQQQMDRRFESMQQQMNRRFESMQQQMGRGFEQADKRFEEILGYMEKRFEQVDNRFEEMLGRFDKRFEQVDKRFGEMHGRFRMMFTFMTVGFTILALLMTLFKFLQ